MLRWFRLCVALLAVAASVATPRSASAYATHTYDVIVHAYCPSATSCSGMNETQLAAHFRHQLEMVNEVWRPTGVSFRLREAVLTSNPSYAAIEYSAAVDDQNSTDGSKIKAMRDAAMASDPDAITIIALPLLTTCWSSIPGGTPPYTSANYGLFCNVTAGWSVLAHELGHHFCLSHPFTFQDRDEPGFVGHDGDGLSDTPPDPGLLEDDITVGGADLDGSGNLREAHEWCDYTVFHDVDPGSPVNAYCTSQCKYRYQGQTQATGEAPDTALAMSYYKHACIGPYVIGGVRTEAFDPQGISLINTCIATIPERQGYTDVCGQEPDSDSDGLCDSQDSCPNAPNVGFDTDGDGVDDACDLCITKPDPSNKDTDGDGVGDVCDSDIDNDGCYNSEDDDPELAVRREGSYLTPNCDLPSKPRFVFAGSDSDGDGLLDCNKLETDDDNDGTPDATDVCPTVPGNDILACQQVTAGCPLVPIDEACIVGCGFEFELVVSSVINPVDEITFRDFSRVGDALFVKRPAGMTTSEVARVMDGTYFMDTPGFDGQLLFEIVSIADGQTVATLPIVQTGRTSPAILDGTVVMAELAGPDGAWQLEGTWALSIRASEFGSDSDGDGVPDPADNCTNVPNLAQNDRDFDHHGDGCDADFDNNQIVTQEEVDLVSGCVGVNLTPDALFGEPSVPIVPHVAPAADVIRAEECGQADLDDDGEITAADVALAQALLGLPPGPSGSIDYVIPGTGEDMGMTSDDVGTADMGQPQPDTGPSEDLGAPDQGRPTGLATDTGGCSCRTAYDASPGGWAALLLLAAVGLRRRRS